MTGEGGVMYTPPSFVVEDIRTEKSVRPADAADRSKLY